MLNYVWVTLIFLGLASALFIDISDITKNTYKNDVPLTVTITISGLKSGGGFDCEVNIPSENYNKFFNSEEKGNVVVNALGSFSADKKAIQLYIKTKDNTPKNLLIVAKASGKEDDILASAGIVSKQDSVTYSAKMYFEKISFLSMKRVTNDAIGIAGTAVEIALGLIGIMAMWLGIMKVAEDAGLIKIIANWLRPITTRLFPEVPPRSSRNWFNGNEYFC